jgi:hypothetical protein
MIFEGKARRLHPMLSALFHEEDERHYPVFSKIWLLAWSLFGAILWGIFLNWGKIPFDFHDWAEINAPRFAFLRDAVIKGVLPLHMPDGSALRNLTDRFMSLPDVFLSPQVQFMRFLDVGSFVLVNTLLVYALGVWGLWRLKKRFALSPVMFAFLFLLFNFNGHILAHTSIGHITWGGYYLSPWFFVLVFRLLDGDHRWLWSVEMALFLFVTFLQGSFHQFVWECMFLGLLGMVAWKHWLPLLKTLTFAGLFSMVRFLPPTLLLGQFDTDFYGGYRLPWQLLESMVKQVTPATSKPFVNFGSNLGYWEFDLYVGWAGLFFILIGLFLWLKPQITSRRFSPLLFPMIVLTLFSIRDFYLPFARLPIPLLNAERVTSRMAILPFTLVMILAAPAIQAWLDRAHRPIWVYITAFLGLVYVGIDLSRRVWQWQVLKAFPQFPTTPVNLAIKVVSNHPDPAYTNLLAWGAGVSITSLAAAGFFVWREQKKAHDRNLS